ncbi:hypothetical protein NKH74_10655 [Mesorhizobium sp. M0933]|uniref:hypothetical protein n=1 Tax=Mesorhizobium sp. M0933 TaxID=2957030 RepID=UPI00333DA039
MTKMMHPAHVLLPEAGADAYLHLDIEAWEILEQDYGDAFLSIVAAGLRYPAPAIVARCLALSIKNVPDEAMADAPWGLTLDELARRLNDALHLMWRGKTVAEIEEEHAREVRIGARKAAAEMVTETEVPA